ncbi:MAG TPA: N-formylglutamate amidohydrolase [Candidatus Sulfotelmatobacter sp.]|nr:N-formylglutamate amidohydrolase [Candidatus Sulfotelmatobacter sp.]
MYARRQPTSPADEAAIAVAKPTVQTIPLVFSSPHSGTRYPADFVAASRLEPLALRRSEDSFVDEIFAAAPRLGAPLVQALFARAYCDANREPYELDPTMFEDELPAFANTASLRVAGGLGTIARVVGVGGEIYRRKLTFAEAELRIDHCYRPYHAALEQLLEATRRSFGVAVLVDCHSMPSVGGPMDRDEGRVRPEVVLGDRYGSACAPALVDLAERTLAAMGYRVARNQPYAGGFNTHHYGRPAEGLHALQIEINRATYMDEARIERRPSLAAVSADMTRLIEMLGRVDQRALRPSR